MKPYSSKSPPTITTSKGGFWRAKSEKPEMNNVDLGKYKQIVRYFWDPEPKNDDTCGTPIWCLGEDYTAPVRTEPDSAAEKESLKSGSPSDSTVSHSSVDSRPSTNATTPGADERPLSHEHHEGDTADGGWPSAFLDDFESRIWLTYRSNFPAIPRSKDPNAASSMTFSVRLRSQLIDTAGFTSDTGWGCMIRSGQSLLANTLSVLRLGRGWRRGANQHGESKLLSLFADDHQAPFSIHRFVEYGASACGKHPGEWFGPSATAKCIQALSEDFKDAGLSVYVTNDDSEVYEDRFREIATSRTGQMTPTLILLGIRLGIDRVTPVYHEALKACLHFPQSVGIAGGRPSSSHYFLGVQDSHFFFLDPHQTRPALPYHSQSEDYTRDEIESCHTRRLRRLHLREMDPSMLLGFLIKDEADWENWKRALDQVPGKHIIRISDKAPPLHGHGPEREGAADEVETLDDDEDGEYVVTPSA